VSLHGQGTIGDYWWGGWAGTYFWIDPKEEISVVYMMQDTSNRVHLLRFK
jgi:CubicO group peptidase (beta-lactamase class C family)